MPHKTPTYIEKLIEQGEHQHLDFKFAVNDSRKIARSLVAFANTKGGKLLIGVKDNGVIAGVRTVEEYYMVESAALIYSKPSIHFFSHEWNIGGKKVLEISVDEGKHKPYKALGEDGKWLAYQRVDDQNIVANSVLLAFWQRQSEAKNTFIQYGENQRFFLELLERNGFVTLSEFVERSGVKKAAAEKILVDYLLLGIIEMDMLDDVALYKLKVD
jgi:predicted HTH transcriptional regulator